MGILSSCILHCRWSGLTVCIQSCIISHWTHSTWLGKRDLIVCSDLRVFVCGFGGQRLELVSSELPALIVHECSGLKMLSFQREEKGKSCELGEGAWPFALFNVIQLLGAGANFFTYLRKALMMHVAQFYVKSPRDNLELYSYFHRRKTPKPHCLKGSG